MDAPSGLRTADFSHAKAQLSDIMTSVVHYGRPCLVLRHHGKESMVLIRPDDVIQALSSFRLAPQVIVDAGEVTVRLEPLGVLGFGETVDAAMEDLVEELRAYAERFFDNPALYRASDRAHHLPWLLRFALTPPDRQLHLLLDDARTGATEGMAVSAAET